MFISLWLSNRPIGLLSVFTGRDPSGRFFRGFVAFSIHREKAYETQSRRRDTVTRARRARERRAFYWDDGNK